MKHKEKFYVSELVRKETKAYYKQQSPLLEFFEEFFDENENSWGYKSVDLWNEYNL